MKSEEYRAEQEDMANRLRILTAEVCRTLKDDPSLRRAAKIINDLIYAAGAALAEDEPNMTLVMGALFVARAVSIALMKNPMLDSPALAIQVEDATERMIAEAMKS